MKTLTGGLILLFCFCFTTPLYADGYDETVLGWNDLKEKSTAYGPFLHALYDQTEASFCKNLIEQFPQSVCNPEPGGVSGILQVDPQTTVNFDSYWNITLLTMTNPQTTLRYYFYANNSTRKDTIEIIKGTDTLVIKIDPLIPSQSRFITAYIPDLADKIQNSALNSLTLEKLLTEYYGARLSENNLRMDTLAIQLLTEPKLQEQFVSAAGNYYQNRETTKDTRETTKESPGTIGDVEYIKDIKDKVVSVGQEALLLPGQLKNEFKGTGTPPPPLTDSPYSKDKQPVAEEPTKAPSKEPVYDQPFLAKKDYIRLIVSVFLMLGVAGGYFYFSGRKS